MSRGGWMPRHGSNPKRSGNISVGWSIRNTSRRIPLVELPRESTGIGWRAVVYTSTPHSLTTQTRGLCCIVNCCVINSIQTWLTRFSPRPLEALRRSYPVSEADRSWTWEGCGPQGNPAGLGMKQSWSRRTCSALGDQENVDCPRFGRFFLEGARWRSCQNNQ